MTKMTKVTKFVANGILLAVGLPALAQTATPAPAPVPVPVSGSWKVTGNVQGVPVNLTCALTTAVDKTVSGNCVDDQSKSHAVTGSVKDQTLSWKFDSEYEGSPITVMLVGTIDGSGAKMAGTISVDPMAVDGDFIAILQVSA